MLCTRCSPVGSQPYEFQCFKLDEEPHLRAIPLWQKEISWIFLTTVNFLLCGACLFHNKYLTFGTCLIGDDLKFTDPVLR